MPNIEQSVEEAVEPVVVPSRWTLLCKALVCAILICLALDAVFDRAFTKNVADGVSYLDIGDSVARGDVSALLNAYWSPAYPVVLLAGLTLIHPPPTLQLATIYGTNAVVAVFALCTLLYLVTGLPARTDTTETFGLSRPMLTGLACALFMISIEADVPVEQITPDLLLGGLLWLSGGAMLRISSNQKLFHYVLLAVSLSLAYFTKAVALPLAIAALAMLPFMGRNRNKALRGLAVASAVTAAFVAPYIGQISKRKGRFTFGDTGALNYAWIVDGSERVEVQNDSRQGHASLHLLHPTRRLLAVPAVYEFAEPVKGTFPAFDDPSYWDDGLRPRLYLKGEIWHIAMNLFHTFSWLARRGAIVVGLLFLLILRRRARIPFARDAVLPLLLWFGALWGIYLMVDVEDRYVFGALIAVIILIASGVRLPNSGTLRTAVTTCIVLVVCGIAVRALEFRTDKAYLAVKEKEIGPYHDPYWAVGENLRNRMGLRQGDTLACLEKACESPYWARLEGFRVVADLPREAEYWTHNAEVRGKVLSVLDSIGVRALVSRGLGEGAESEGWIPLGSNLYARATTTVDSPSALIQRFRGRR